MLTFVWMDKLNANFESIVSWIQYILLSNPVHGLCNKMGKYNELVHNIIDLHAKIVVNVRGIYTRVKHIYLWVKGVTGTEREITLHRRVPWLIALNELLYCKPKEPSAGYTRTAPSVGENAFISPKRTGRFAKLTNYKKDVQSKLNSHKKDFYFSKRNTHFFYVNPSKK